MSSPTFERASLEALVARFSGRRLLVLGDLMIDHYLWGRVERISPEAPVPVVEVQRETSSLGGAGNVAANLAALGAEPVLVGLVGEDVRAQQLLEAFAARQVATHAIVRDPSRPTTMKTRVIAHSQRDRARRLGVARRCRGTRAARPARGAHARRWPASTRSS
jgi:D-beta-D-heptose 7-phosphate kinase/D-beta-D-heptose 1-phosphate adenosyltransferase